MNRTDPVRSLPLGVLPACAPAHPKVLRSLALRFRVGFQGRAPLSRALGTSLLAPVLVAVLVALPGTAHGQEPVGGDRLPTVHVLATGGTISNTEGDRLTGDELVRSLPGVESVAEITVEQFANVASGSISLDQWLAMARRIDELFGSGPEPAGVVITHGTDTMEETAYFLDLTLAHCRPVVVTGAMRRASAHGADGPANLYNSIRVAASAEMREIGAAVLMNDEVFPAREVLKAHTSRVNAFVASGRGRIVIADPDALVVEGRVGGRDCGNPAFDVSGVEALPRVDVVYTYLGADGALIRAAADAGATGIVVASVGRGGSTPGQREAIREVRERGVTVVMSSRTGAGRVPVGRGGQGGEGGAFLGADDLSPQKARILLMLALTRTDDPDELRRIFETH
jgi:L-asparaginase